MQSQNGWCWLCPNNPNFMHPQARVTVASRCHPPGTPSRPDEGEDSGLAHEPSRQGMKRRQRTLRICSGMNKEVAIIRIR